MQRSYRLSNLCAPVLLLAVQTTIWAHPTPALSKCDVNRSGSTDVADVQLVVNEALGVSLAVDDLNGDSHVNLVDVQIVINAAVSLVCTADSGSSPAPTITDFNPKTGAYRNSGDCDGQQFRRGTSGLHARGRGWDDFAVPLSGDDRRLADFCDPQWRRHRPDQ